MQPAATATADHPLGALPDHTQLPDRDGAIVNNFQEHPQSSLLKESLWPRLCELHPDGQFCIGCDSGIYWRYTQPPLDGCKAPDWFYVPGVPPLLDGQLRRSYVLWKEGVRPLLVIEYVSGDGSEEHDRAPYTGKFWVYEQGIAATYYAIFDGAKSAVELYCLERGKYQPIPPNAAGRYPIEPLGVELGIWEGTHWGLEVPWLRVWDSRTGIMLLNEAERVAAERTRANQAEERASTAESLVDDARRLLEEECERAEAERRRAEVAEQRMAKMMEQLRSQGLDPDSLGRAQ